jgi:hypothetical protein
VITAEWKTNTLASAEDMEEVPVRCAPRDAQPWCDFVVWTPGRMPAGCTLEVGTLRKEAPPGRVEGMTVGRAEWGINNPCAYRFEIVGYGRRLRVKQFLYEWVFPALDHPCLWQSQTRAVALNEQYVLWFGVDYYQRRGASARLGRTNIEVSVLEGEFSDDELVDLYRSLRQVDYRAAAAIGATPFARLTYWARRQDAMMVSVPIGLWVFRRAQGPHDDVMAMTGTAAETLLPVLRLPAELGGLALDSAARFTRDGAPAELEAIYTGGADRGHELRLIVQENGSGRLEVPARPEPHPCTRDTVSVAGVSTQLAWIDDRYGPFDAVLADPVSGLEAKLLSSTGPGRDKAWFLAALDELITALRAGNGVDPPVRSPR